MLTRIELDPARYEELRQAMADVSRRTELSIRTWSPEISGRRPRLAICVTYRPEPALALLSAISEGSLKAEPRIMLGNREACRRLAEEFNVPWFNISECIGPRGYPAGGTQDGKPDDERMIDLCDEHEVDYIILARYMRVLPAASCWKYAGGRIINLHHGLLPSFPGMQPYHEAYASRMLTYGATCHFIVPELDAGCQIIYQSTFMVPPGMPRNEIIRRGVEENEPHCLVEGVRRVVVGEVQLHFNRVVARK
jgi:formyltetrahydrofolate deformylase